MPKSEENQGTPWRPHEGQRIDRIYAWVATEPDGGEGVCSAKIGGLWMPLIGADMARIESLRGAAQLISRESGCPVHLVEFSGRRVLEAKP